MSDILYAVLEETRRALLEIAEVTAIRNMNNKGTTEKITVENPATSSPPARPNPLSNAVMSRSGKGRMPKGASGPASRRIW